MPPATSRMFTSRISQAPRVFLRPNGRRLAAVSPDTELKSSAIRAQPESDAVAPSLESQPTAADTESPVADQVEPAPAATTESQTDNVSEESEETQKAQSAESEDVEASETSHADPASGSSAKTGDSASEAPKLPSSEYISVEDFPYSVGDIVTGRVLFSNARGARVAIHGVKGVLGYLPKNRGPYHLRNSRSNNSYTDGMAPVLPQGTTRRFKILALPPDMAKGGKGPLLVCDQLDLELMWKRVQAIKELSNTMRETIRVTVTGAVERGLLINLFGVRGFVPVSHVTREDDQEWLAKEDLEKLIGREIEVSLMVLDEEKRTFTCSMTNAVSDRALRQLRIGSLVWGTVRRLTNYGLFLSLDNTYERALLHITNVSWNRVPSVEDVFCEGDRIRAVVIGMDEGFSRISVSTRDLEENEGDMLSDPQKVYDNAEAGVQRFLKHVKEWEAKQANGEEQE